MEPERHRPTKRDWFHVKWAVIAAILGALVGAALQHLVSRDVTDAKLIEISQELAKERSRSDNLELQLNQINRGSESEQSQERTHLNAPAVSLDAKQGSADSRPEPIAAIQAAELSQPLVPVEKELVFPTPYYRFVITSVTKAGGSVRVNFFVEATGEEKIEIAYGGCGIGGPDEVYLVDENGERLELDYRNEGSRLFTKRFEKTELFPNTRLKGNFLFLAKSESIGSQFTLVIRECAPQPGTQRVINGLAES